MSNDVSLKENGIDTVPNGINVSDRENGGKTDSRIATGQRGTGRNRRIEEFGGESQSLEENDEAKEVEEKVAERKWSRIESKDEKLVAKPIDSTSNYLKKMEMERQTTNDISKEDKTRNLINEDGLIKPVSQSAEKSEFVMHNLSNSVNLEPSTVSLPYENVLDVPKTPTSTPTRSSVVENSLGNSNNEETFDSRETNVLNSLECAKKKLLAVNDDSVEMFDEEEAMSARQKADFHGKYFSNPVAC